MADFQVSVVRIEDPVEDHPNADRLSIIKIGGYVAISAKLEDGSHRYKQGDLVVYIPEQALVPEWLLKKGGFWDAGKDRGMLSGSGSNRVKAIRLRGVFSQGLLYPIRHQMSDDGHDAFEWLYTEDPDHLDDTRPGVWWEVDEGDDVAKILGITKWEPTVPASFRGNMGALYGVTKKYDFESIQKATKLFEAGEIVVAHEKCHGTLGQFGYVPGQYEAGGDFYVTSKGLGAKGFNLKDVPENDGNLYVQQLRKLHDSGTTSRMKVLSGVSDDAPVRIYGEIVGQGVQDLGYGHKEPQLYVFDIQVGDEFLAPSVLEDIIKTWGLKAVPKLYEGPFDLDALAKVRDGKDTISGTHVREGIVIKAADGSNHERFGRKIAKFVSPDYLLRKGETTEFS